MKIAAALTSMEAARTYTEVNSFTMGLRTDQQASPFEPDNFTTRFRSLINNSSPPPGSKPARIKQPCIFDVPGTNAEKNSDSLLETLRALTGEIVGEPIRISATDREETVARETKPAPSPMQATITSRLIHYEREEVYFSSSGTVATEDGRELSFSLDLSMQRTTRETLEVSVQGGLLTKYLIDPLVLSFTGGPPVFSTTSFLFDLDCDGREDNIAELQSGCGFLAFDKNEDGVINNGLELFGPQSGDGFTDLSAFDTDSNLWIDENDPIFESLSVWRKDDQGEDILQSLKEAGVGAISLSHAGCQFTLQGSDNEIIAQVAANGIFLTEDGEVRSLQEVDLAIDDMEQETGKGDRSPEDVVLDAIVSMRILIAMQRMRARLTVARHRLENRFQGSPFTLEHLQPPFSGTDRNRQETLGSDHVIAQAKGTGEQVQPEPVDDSAQTDRVGQHFPHQDRGIHPMHSLDEMHNFVWPGKSRRGKNQYFRMP